MSPDPLPEHLRPAPAGLAAQAAPSQQQHATSSSSSSSKAGRSPGSTAGGRSSSPGAAAAARRQRPQLTQAELREKAAFRACDRLMEKGATDEGHLWTVARVMSGTEYEQAAEERALAGKCGNPLCGNAPQHSTSSGSGGSGRHRLSQLAVSAHAAAQDEERDHFCGGQCAADVKRFAARLGSGAMALERFSAMFQQLRQQDQQQQGQQQQQQAQSPAASSAPSQAVAAQQPGSAPAAAAGAADGDGQEEDGSSRDSAPGGIKSATTLVPRLAVEQVEVKKIDSSAGQFGDFSRKLPVRPAGAAGAPKPKGVLKKESRFAAGTAKVPIMLAEVRERDPSDVAADTARSLPRPGAAAAVGSKSSAVEGYVPRSLNSQQQKRERQERQRRVRWSDEVDEDDGEEGAPSPGPEEAAQAEAEGQAADVQQQQQQQVEQATPAEQPPAETATQHAAGQPARHAAAAGEQPSDAAQRGDGAAPGSAAAPAAGGSAAGPPAGPTGSVLVFDIEEPKRPLDAGQAGLASQFGRLRVADAASVPIATAPSPVQSTPPPAAPAGQGAPGTSPSNSIDIQRGSAAGGQGSAGGRWSVPQEWREVPQFYAHSPVGSSSSLAGSLASPAGSSNSLATAAGAGSPPMRSRSMLDRPPPSPTQPPPGLPRGPSASRPGRLGGSDATLAAIAGGQLALGAELDDHPQQAQRPQQQQQQQQEQGQAGSSQPGEPPFLTKRQAQQLQRAFPPLAATLPPELQAALASDSESEAELEDWMQSDDELARSSEDELMEGGRSGYRIQLSFFGTLFTHLEAWVTENTVELLASGPDAPLALPPPTSPEVLATLNRFLAAALPPVLTSLQSAAPRGDVERSLNELLHTFRLVGPLPAFKVGQWQVVAVLLLKALSLERCPPLREAFETREGIGRLNQLLGSLSFTSEEFYAALELLLMSE